MHTHFHPATSTFFTPDNCENCNGTTVGVNAVTLLNPRTGHSPVFVNELPAESWWDDEAECEVCENCTA